MFAPCVILHFYRNLKKKKSLSGLFSQVPGRLWNSHLCSLLPFNSCCSHCRPCPPSPVPPTFVVFLAHWILALWGSLSVRSSLPTSLHSAFLATSWSSRFTHEVELGAPGKGLMLVKMLLGSMHARYASSGSHVRPRLEWSPSYPHFRSPLLALASLHSLPGLVYVTNGRVQKCS